MTDEIMTPEEAASFLKVDVDTICELLDSGDLAGRKLGSHWRTTKRALLTLIDAVSSECCCADGESGCC